MKIISLLIKNFKTIRELNIDNIENAMIIVGKNSTGKTTILHAIRAVTGQYEIRKTDFQSLERSVEIAVNLEITSDDIRQLHDSGAVSKFKSFDMWYKDFCKRLPTFIRNLAGERYEDDEPEAGLARRAEPELDPAQLGDDWVVPDREEGELGGVLKFTFVTEPDLTVRYSAGENRNNEIIPEILPKVLFIDTSRNIHEIEDEILYAETKDVLTPIRDKTCILNSTRTCTHSMECIPSIMGKKPEELSIAESMKLLEYKLMQVNMDAFIEKLNRYYARNSGKQQGIRFGLNLDSRELLKMGTQIQSNACYGADTIDTLSTGAKSIYILSLLEAYVDDSNSMPSIIMIEDPEIYLHPQLQKTASEVLYRLSKKNQVIFSTHSPNLIFNFNSKQIRQVVLDNDYNTTINGETDIDEILDDLGYSANDFMNVNFVFIVEGKQDSNRLPLLLNKYYSEIYGEDGRMQRVSIITTNSCTNIKTYANLKYMNKLYLKDQFLMIRDSDGKKPETLVKQLCAYYYARSQEDNGNLPRIQPRNVLVLKYYSFENYFLNPKIMAKIGVIKNEEDFYNILLDKFKSYLFKLQSVRRMRDITGLNVKTKEDLKRNMETIKIYVRGHNLFDIFYGRYKGEAETEILTRYIEEAPRSEFADILNAIDNFIFFMNRRREDEDEEEDKQEIVYEKHKKKKKYNRI